MILKYMYIHTKKITYEFTSRLEDAYELTLKGVMMNVHSVYRDLFNFVIPFASTPSS